MGGLCIKNPSERPPIQKTPAGQNSISTRLIHLRKEELKVAMEILTEEGKGFSF